MPRKKEEIGGVRMNLEIHGYIRGEEQLMGDNA